MDQVFPPVGVLFDPEFEFQEFSNFVFWRESLADVKCEDFEELK